MPEWLVVEGRLAVRVARRKARRFGHRLHRCHPRLHLRLWRWDRRRFGRKSGASLLRTTLSPAITAFTARPACRESRLSPGVTPWALRARRCTPIPTRCLSALAWHPSPRLGTRPLCSMPSSTPLWRWDRRRFGRKSGASSLRTTLTTVPQTTQAIVDDEPRLVHIPCFLPCPCHRRTIE